MIPASSIPATKIPLLDLTAQYRAIKPEIDRAVLAVIERGKFILGPEVEALEREVAAFCGTSFAVGVANGTDALELSLRALGIGPGDEVITTAYSFFATVEVIVTVGATPVFVDIEPVTYNLDPDALASAVTPKTKAIIPVHLYGHPCAMDRVLDVAKRHQLKIVEDCAQAIGATYRGARVGSLGDTGCFSFFPSKNLGAYGDGGMVTTNDSALAERLRLLRAHGSRARYHHEMIGRNSRLDELQAAILRVKLRYLDRWNAARAERARWYAEAFRAAGAAGIGVPVEREGCRHVYHQYCIRLRHRDRVKEALAAQGIATQVYYPSTLPVQPALAAFAPSFRPCPQADAATRELLALPIYPELEADSIRLIASHIAKHAAA